jgi:cytochrome c oxidase cbb3-type subunit 3
VAQEERKKENLNEPKTTGHEWDGIKEYDNPDPLWLRLAFYAALFFALGYWLAYPSWPSQYNQGIFNWSEYSELAESLQEVKQRRAAYLNEFNKANFQEILSNKELFKFATIGGRAAFLNNCAVCHGSGAQGNIGYPNLTTGAWLWGGKLEDIYQTIKFGIRSGHEETRDSQMAAFGQDGLLAKDEIELLTDFVMGLHQGKNNSPKANELYQKNCASCHGDKGQGNFEFGAPALNDAIWLYGSDRETIYNVIYYGRQGVMPYWVGKLDDSTIRQLAIYVHSLGGGQ